MVGKFVSVNGVAADAGGTASPALSGLPLPPPPPPQANKTETEQMAAICLMNLIRPLI
jgi:hypothetical protein